MFRNCAANGSLAKAATSTERATTLDATPKLAQALDDDQITSDHVDAVTRVSKRLEGVATRRVATAC